jgi:hypothetical protein
LVVRVKVKLSSSKGAELAASAIANSGFESDEPEVIVPEKVAERLGLYPKLPEGVEVEEYRSVGGRFKAYRARGFTKIWVLSDDRNVGPVDVALTIVPEEDEILLSDKLLDALEIELTKPGEGLWRFRGEAKQRRSAQPERF